MEFEAPMDAWIVYVGVATVGVAILGVALGFSPIPPPDATAAANAIDSAGGSEIGGITTYEHDAESFWLDRQQIALKNDGGTSKATIAFDTMTGVYYDDSEQLADVLYGTPIDTVFSDASDPDRAFLAAVAEAQIKAASKRGEWKSAQGTVRAKKINIPDLSIEFTTDGGQINDYSLTDGREEVTLVAV
jgi:hypothetical protein